MLEADAYIHQRLGCLRGLCSTPDHYVAILCLLQLALEQADELMDIAAAGEGGYDAIRQQLAEAYQKAGLADVANFIKAA